MQNKPKLSIEEISSLILLAAILFGAAFRFFPSWEADFPVNDGGMFYVMMEDLKSNHYIPPMYTTYNHIDIPFAYPPLALYLGAILSSLLHVSGITILRWIPPLINSLCVPIFYLLSKEILEDKFKSAVATLIFALIPHLNTWLSAGGGLTRSLGILFMMLTVMYSYKLFARNHLKSIWGTMLFGGLTVLSHPEATIFAITLAIYIWFAKSRTLKSALYGFLVALGVILIAGPWYFYVISRYGPAPIVSALQTGGQLLWSVLLLVNVNFMTEEPYLSLISVIGVLGVVILVTRREFFIPLMLLIIYLVQPRGAPTVGNIPLAMAAGVFIVEVLMPVIMQNKENYSRAPAIAVFIIIPYILSNSIYQGLIISQNHVSTGEQTAMKWIKENTSPDSTFLILTGEPEAMCESTAEWFPALTDRTSLSTLQGREWLLGNQFAEFIGHHASLQSCIDEGEKCLNREMEYFGNQINYIYISTRMPTYGCKAEQAPLHETRGLAIALAHSPAYQLVYDSESVYLFEKISK